MKKLAVIKLLLLGVFVFCCMGCAKKEDATRQWQTINGRDNRAIYQVKAPASWEKKLPDPSSLTDTKTALIEFSVGNQIRITIHNFPSHNINKRIPPQAHMNRWEKQFEKLDPVSVSVTPQAYGGFSGYFYEASGTQNGKETTVLAWIMQLSPDLFRKASYDPQIVADYTIKVQGHPLAISQHKNEIIHFARSFELINPFINSL